MKLVDCFTNFLVFIYKFVNQFKSVTFLGIHELCLNSFLNECHVQNSRGAKGHFSSIVLNTKAQSKYKTKPMNTRY